MSTHDAERGAAIAAKVEAFVREVVAPYERDPRCGAHGPSDALIGELREKARAAGVLTPHILADGGHISHRETAQVLRAAGLSTRGRRRSTSPRPTRATCIFWVGSLRLSSGRGSWIR